MGRGQAVRQRVLIPSFPGSIPGGPANRSTPKKENGKAGVAQLARASAFQAEGREFESRFPLHSISRYS